MSSSACPSCGLKLPDHDGPADPYGAASPACWAMFGEVTARDYGAYEYPPVHRLIVDAYQAQHVGYATAAGRRSVVVHLVGLCLVLEKMAAPGTVGRALGAVFPDKPDVEPLVPIPRATLTIAHVHEAKSLGEQTVRGEEFAREVWRAWTPHHARVRAWAEAAASRIHGRSTDAGQKKRGG